MSMTSGFAALLSTAEGRVPLRHGLPITLDDSPIRFPIFLNHQTRSNTLSVKFPIFLKHQTGPSFLPSIVCQTWCCPAFCQNLYFVKQISLCGSARHPAFCSTVSFMAPCSNSSIQCGPAMETLLPACHRRQDDCLM